MAITSRIPIGVDQIVTVVDITGGVDTEDDDDLQSRVLSRTHQPPMGGDKQDYVDWTRRVPGVTRAWCYPLEMGVGTVTVRFMMDDLRTAFNGFPQPNDVDIVAAYLDTVRPVAIKDFFVVSPIPFPIDLSISDLDSDDSATRANISAKLSEALFKLAPGDTVYRSVLDAAISEATGESHHELIFTTTQMAGSGYLPVLGTISYR